MNTTKSNSPIRLIAFFLVAVILVCTFGFTADGWELSPDTDSNIVSGDKNDNSNEVNGVPDGDISEPEDNPEEPEIYIPEYTAYLTGLECAEETSKNKPVAIVLDSASVLYGISYSDMLCEVPTENGKTRLISFLQSTENVYKIGPIAATRGYISNLAKYFSSIYLSSGYDDKINYHHFDVSDRFIDLSTVKEYCYKEHNNLSFTNQTLLNNALTSSQYDLMLDEKAASPFKFSDFGSEEIKGIQSANYITLSYSDSSKSILNYDSESKTYDYKKSEEGNVITTDKQASFKNCLVLFSDSVTYESTGGVQTVIDTIEGGDGYYFTEGTLISIKWSVSDEGDLTLTRSDGNELILNRGTTYIAFMKSSRFGCVTFS